MRLASTPSAGSVTLMLVVRPGTILTGRPSLSMALASSVIPARSPESASTRSCTRNICGVAARHRSERGTVSRIMRLLSARLIVSATGTARMPPETPPSASTSSMRRAASLGFRQGLAASCTSTHASLSNPALRRPLTTDSARSLPPQRSTLTFSGKWRATSSM